MKSGSLVAVCYAVLFLLWKINVIGSFFQENTSKCNKLITDVAELNKKTKIIFPPRFVGKWVSQRCEIRAGPRYILRSYTFYSNNTFCLVQFYYNDESCSSIKYTVKAIGSYKIITSFATGMAYNLYKVTVVAHDIPSANNLSASVNKVCPSILDEYWKPFEEYTIVKRSPKRLDLADEQSDNNYHTFTKTTSGVEENLIQPDFGDKCLSSIDLSFNELHELRVQIRPTFDDIFRHELLLGNMYMYSSRRRQVMRNKFQLPLVLVNESTNCLICDVISQSTNMFVRHIPAKPILPLQINGEWISETCETQWMGIFSIRNFKVNQQTFRWELETRFYSNFICSNLIMIHRTFGRYNEDKLSKTVSGATEVHFKIEKSYLTLTDATALDIVQVDPLCGPHYWQVGVSKEIPARLGCSIPDIMNPVIKSDIIRLDTDERGSYILYLGDKGINEGKPTTYQYPLLQCDSDPDNFQLFAEEDVSDSANSMRTSTFIIILFIVNFFCL